MTNKEYYTLPQAAELEGVTPKTINARVKAGVYGEEGISWKKSGIRILIDKEVIDREYYTMKEVAELHGVIYLTVFNRLHAGEYGKEGEGWIRVTGGRSGRILIKAEMV